MPFTNDDIAGLLINNLYNSANVLPCGPGLRENSYHKKIIYGLSENKELPYIVPQETYHPRVWVSFDFTHQFTGGFSSTELIPAKRPVSFETFFRAGFKLLRFFDYYFEYALSYGKDMKKTNLRKLVENPAPDEREFAIFINYIINFYFNQVTISKAVNQIGTAAITITDNKNFNNGKKWKLFYDDAFSIFSQLFAPMIPVTVWSTGRLYPDWVFPIYDGFVYTVSPTDSADSPPAIVLNCKDALELARTSTEMINPSLIQFKELLKQNSINILSQPFFGYDHFEIVERTFRGGKLIYNPGTERIEIGSPEYEKANGVNLAALGNYQLATTRSEEKTGTFLQNAIDERVFKYDDFSLARAVELTSYNRPRYLMLWGTGITPYRQLTTGNSSAYTAEFTSRLDILDNLASMTYFNYYVDGFGNINYHPMRTANKFLEFDYVDYDTANVGFALFPGAQIIDDEELFSISRQVNVDQLVTFLRVAGQPEWIGSNPPADLLGIVGSAANFELMARFGYRRDSIVNPLLNISTRFKLPGPGGSLVSYVDLVAQSILQFKNSELSTATCSIPFRPELELAKPVLFPRSRDVYYVQSITHNITINGSATTTINANYGRKENEPVPDLLNFMIVSQKLYKNKKIEPLSPNATEEEITLYYQRNFGLDQIPFKEWFDESLKLQRLYEEAEKKRSEKQAKLYVESIKQKTDEAIDNAITGAAGFLGGIFPR